MKTVAFLFLTFTIITLNIACSDNGTEPKKEKPDTTSHNFSWRIDTLGKYPSFFHDVIIIDPDNIWAVGEVNTDSGTYGGAHWDGVKWRLQKFARDGNPSVSPIKSIQNVSDTSTNFWVVTGSIYLWDGVNLNRKWRVPSFGKGVEQIWKVADDDIYFVGGLGTIVHYNGSSFSELTSNTDIRLQRISGNSKGNLFVTGYEDNLESIALEINSGSVKEVYHSTGVPNIPQKNYGRFLSVWIGSNNAYFLTVAGLFTVDLETRNGILSTNFEITYPFATHDIEGQAENDIVIISNRGKVVHWNGSSWALHNEIYDQYPDHILTTYGADYNSETVAYVGPYQFGNKAFIVIGKHN